MAAKPQHLRLYERLAMELEGMRRRMDGLSSASQLSYSSFDSGPGRGIEETNPETGNPTASFGTQYDGSHGAVVFTGPNPPTPTPALVRSGPGTATFGWDGVFVNANGVRDFTIVPTMDMTHVEVHVSADPDFTADFAETLVGTINTMRGGWVAAVTGEGTFYARLVSRSAAGKRSPASDPIAVTVEGINVDELRNEWEAADNALGNALAQTNQAQQQLATELNALNTNVLPGLSTDLVNARSRLLTAETTLASTVTTANNAATTAGTAASTASTALSTANGKNKRTFSTAAPTASTPGILGDVWDQTNTAGGVTVAQWRHNGATTGNPWAPLVLGDAMLNNLDVSKLTANTGTISQLVAERIAAGTAAIQTVDIGNLFVTGNSALNTVTAQRIAANVGTYMQLSVGQLVAGTASMDTATIQKLFTELFSTRKLTSDQVLVGQGGNYLVDPEFADAAAMEQRLANLNIGLPATGRTVWAPIGATGTDPNGMRTTTAGNGAQTAAPVWWTGTIPVTYANAIQVQPGERFSLWTWVTTSAAAAVTWQMQTFDKGNPASTTTTTVVSTVTGTTGRRFVRADYTVPASGVTAIYPRLLFTNQNTTANTITVWGGAFLRKLNQEALALFSDAVWNTVPYDLRVTIGARPANTSFPDVPGIRFSYRRKDQQDVPPANDAGVVATPPTGTGAGAQLQSSAIASQTDSPFSKVSVDPGVFGMEVRAGGTGGGDKTLLDATPGGFNLRSTTGIGLPGERASIKSDTDSVLRLRANEGIEIDARNAGVANRPLNMYGNLIHQGPATVVGAFSASGNVSLGGDATVQGTVRTNAADSILRLFANEGVDISAKSAVGAANRPINLNGTTTVNGDATVTQTLNVNAVRISGNDPFADTGWQTAQMVNSFTHRTDFNWTGVKWRVKNGYITIQGSAARTTSWIVGLGICNIPAAYVPGYRVMGSNAYADPGGTIMAFVAGGAGGNISFNVMWPLPV